MYTYIFYIYICMCIFINLWVINAPKITTVANACKMRLPKLINIFIHTYRITYVYTHIMYLYHKSKMINYNDRLCLQNSPAKIDTYIIHILTIYIYVCIHICLYTHMIYTYTHNMYTHIIYIHRYVCTHTCYTHIMHTYIIYIYICMFMHLKYVYIHAYM